MAIDAFISYSHDADGKLAPALQRGLQRLAKPWSRRQALRVFRDDTGLSVNPALWQSITAALDDSAYFILLASPGAARSEWVNEEISYWMASRPDAAARMLPVVTAGTWVWDGVAGDIDWAVSTAAPAALAGVFTGEPRHLDLAWAHSEEDLDLRNTRFRAAVADLAAPIHGIPKDELESEDILQHRKAVMLRRAAVASLLLLVVGLGIAGLWAFRSAETARAALRDLEDANGNIDDLSAEGERLAAANEQAAADLAETEAARDDAEALAGQAQEEAAAAVEAREQADAARQSAEGAQAVAEEEQREAEAARNAAEEAQAAAEQGRGAAELAAADAAEAETEARRLEERARAGELSALDARAAAEEASAAARTAEAEARADEEAALAAGEQARQQEAEARNAEAAAQAGERVARAAEVVATAAAEAAAAAAAVAEEAAAAAEQRRGEAEAAAQAASLARAATTQSDPALNALLSVESYCALAPCGAAEQPQGLRTIAPMSAQVPIDPYDPATLDPFVPMIDSVSRHQDLVKVLPGWTGRPVDVATSGDGAVIVALGENGTVRAWSPAAPAGADLGESDTIGIAVSDDGSRVAGVRSLSSGGATFWMRDLTGTFRTEATPDLRALGSAPRTARLSFRPGSAGAVLIDVIGRRCCYRALFDASDRTLLDFGDFFAEFAGFPRFAEWLDSDRILFVDRASAFVMGRDGSELWDIESLHDADPTAITRAGGVVIVGYDDGRVTTVSPDDRRMGVARSVHLEPVHDIAISADGLFAVSSASDGSAVRFDVAPNVVAGPTDELAVRSLRPIPVAMGRVRSDFVVTGVDERVELRTVDLGAAGAFTSSANVSGAPTSSGGLLVATPTGHELTSPEGAVRVHDEAGRTVVSDDGTTFLVTGSPPRVGRIDSSRPDVFLDVSEAVGFSPTLALSSDGAIAAIEVGLTERSIRTFDGRTGGVRDTIEIEPLPSGSFVYLEQLLVSDHVVAFTRVDSGQPSSPRADGFEVRTEIYSTNGGWRRTIVGRSLLSVTPGAGGVVYVGGGNDGVILGHPVDGGEPFEVLDVGLGDVVTAVATEGHGGPLTAVGYQSGNVELWNVETGGLIVELSRHHTPVKAITVGQTVAGLRVSSVALSGGNGDGIVRTLDDPALLRAALCTLAGRNVSQPEWRRFLGVGDPLPCARGL